ncbi:MerR family DNA-binding transcriptional regulator [Lignipirellula cremea]|uniref:Zinc-responsive transcriptional regulator n=1 Tax=Lignipirellula cremea TaxID=2528010 RepID=A0A518DLC8_9BACT|nr:MerR family DNA-binding transcriptional regulator [Lignipirellula cremea]QDU92645.1 zinc-responsive transcriptional regulator [Lignipirellula cremea]
MENLKHFTEQVQDMLRVGEAAKLLGVTSETLRNWDKSGRLVATRHPVTGYRYYRESELERFLLKVVAERKAVTNE